MIKIMIHLAISLVTGVLSVSEVSAADELKCEVGASARNEADNPVPWNASRYYRDRLLQKLDSTAPSARENLVATILDFADLALSEKDEYEIGKGPHELDCLLKWSADRDQAAIASMLVSDLEWRMDPGAIELRRKWARLKQDWPYTRGDLDYLEVLTYLAPRIEAQGGAWRIRAASCYRGCEGWSALLFPNGSLVSIPLAEGIYKFEQEDGFSVVESGGNSGLFDDMRDFTGFLTEKGVRWPDARCRQGRTHSLLLQVIQLDGARRMLASGSHYFGCSGYDGQAEQEARLRAMMARLAPPGE